MNAFSSSQDECRVNNFALFKNQFSKSIITKLNARTLILQNL